LSRNSKGVNNLGTKRRKKNRKYENERRDVNFLFSKELWHLFIGRGIPMEESTIPLFSYE